MQGSQQQNTMPGSTLLLKMKEKKPWWDGHHQCTAKSTALHEFMGASCIEVQSASCANRALYEPKLSGGKIRLDI